MRTVVLAVAGACAAAAAVVLVVMLAAEQRARGLPHAGHVLVYDGLRPLCEHYDGTRGYFEVDRRRPGTHCLLITVSRSSKWLRESFDLNSSGVVVLTSRADEDGCGSARRHELVTQS